MNEKAVKWIVIGVLAVVAIIIFRGEIAKMIGRNNPTEISITKEGLKVLLTPIGETNISAESSPETQYVDTTKVGSEYAYVDRHYKFAINRPPNSEWVPFNRMSATSFVLAAQAFQADESLVFLLFKPATSLEPGVVFIRVYRKETYTNIQILLAAYIKGLRDNGIETLQSKVDEKTGGAVVVTKETKSGWSGVARLLFTDTYAYIVAMKAFPPGEEYAKLRNEVNMIFNSFRILY